AVQAVESAHNYGENRLRLDLTEVAATPAGKALIAELSSPVIDIQTAPGLESQLRLTAQSAGTRAMEWGLVRTSDGAVIRRIPVGPSAAAAIKEAVAGEARWRFVKDMENRDPNARVGVKIRIITVEVEAISSEDK